MRSMELNRKEMAERKKRWGLKGTVPYSQSRICAILLLVCILAGCEDSFEPNGPSTHDLVGTWTSSGGDLPRSKLVLDESGSFVLTNANDLSGAGKWNVSKDSYEQYVLSLLYDDYIAKVIFVRGRTGSIWLECYFSVDELTVLRRVKSK